MRVTELFAGVPTADLAAAAAWYERLLGRPPDLVPNATEVAWQVAGPGWLYLLEDAGRAGGAVLTLLVDDLPGVVAALAGRGIDAGAIDVVAGARRSARLAGPEDALIQLAEILG